MGNTLEEVALTMCEVIHGIYLPLSAGAVVRRLDYAVHNRVAEVHIRGGHIYFGAEHTGTLVKFTLVHTLEEVEILLNRAVAVRTFGAGNCGSAFLSGNLLGGLVVDVCLPFLNQAHCQIVKLREIVGCVALVLAPVEAKPVNVFTDCIDIFRVFLDRVCVVETKEAFAAKLFSGAEVHTDSFSMADVQITVRLRWKTCLKASAIFALFEVVYYHLFHKAQSFALFRLLNIFIF